MLEYIVPLLAAYMPMFEYVLYSYFCLCFLATVPCVVKILFMR